MDIMYTGDDKKCSGPELFIVHHNGDFSGTIRINTERKPEMVAEPGSAWSRHGNAVYEIEIPFEVAAKVVAEMVARRKIADLEEADYREVLGVLPRGGGRW